MFEGVARDLRGALAAGDIDRLCRVPGVGKKTSERLVLELRERSRQAEVESASAGGEVGLGEGRDAEAISALVNLGYKRTEAERVLRTIPAEIRLEEAIREELRRFAR